MTAAFPIGSLLLETLKSRPGEKDFVMGKYIALILWLFFAFDFSIGFAGAEVKGPDISGFFEIEKRLNISDGITNGDTYGTLYTEANYSPLRDLFTQASLKARYYDLPVLEDLPSVSEIESDYPVDLLLWEAYVELSQFLWEDLDLKIGKQQIAWGKADKFNPTDNLNPNDLTDFLDFEAKVPSLALKASYYVNDYTLTAVWLPFFEPALFPRGGTAFLFGQRPGRVKLPAKTLENGMFAFKFEGSAFNIDYSFSYFKGFDDIPVVTSLSDSLEIGFPELQVAGFDFSGEFRSIGFWGELDLFFPKELRSGPVEIQSDDPFLKYTFGLDYTFTNGIYLEAQYVRGFFIERGKDNLHDYLIAKIEKKILNDDLVLSLGGGLEAGEIGRIRENYGTILFPEISYQGIGNVEITAGIYLFEGKKETSLGGWKELDQTYVKIKYDF